jgi:hypothetical protein
MDIQEGDFEECVDIEPFDEEEASKETPDLP